MNYYCEVWGNTPICLSNTLTKVIEFVLLTRMEHFLSSTYNQFGFKPHHSTELCVFVLKEIIRYYIQHGSTMFVAFLDASKAFDRVNHMKLLSKLTLIGVPKYILRFLSYWYSHQSLCVRWRTVYSDLFSVTNSPRQGGRLSPLLFNIYINDLSLALSKQPAECYCGKQMVNHIIYADDLVVFAPAGKGLQKLISCCFGYGCENDIIYNASKSNVMFFKTKQIYMQMLRYL